MSHCEIKECINNRQRKNEDRDDFTLHRVPVDPNLSMLWLSVCGLENKTGKDNRRVCSRHFEVRDFKKDAKGRNKLIDRAVPTQFLPDVLLLPKADYVIKLPDCGKKHKNFFIAQLGNGTVIKITFDVSNNLLAYPKLFNSHPDVVGLLQEERNLEETCHNIATQRLENRNKQLRKIIKSCRKAKSLKIKKDKQKRMHEIHKCQALRNRVHVLEGKLRTTKQDCKRILEQGKADVLKNFTTIFSPTQLKMIRTKQKKSMWGEIDIARAISLRAKSSRCYRFVRDVFNIPLPGVSTLKKYCQKIKMKPGIQGSVLNLLKEEFSSFSEAKRQAILSFDEMAIDSSACYDVHEDKIYGQKKNMNLAVIRGLIEDWKQPVYFSFDQMSTENIHDIIKKCYSVGITIRGFVCDLGGTNRGLWNKLGIKIDKSYILHPVTSEKVWCFADVPHLIKLLRNNLLDYGFLLACEKKICKKDLELLLNSDCNEFQMQYKLTEYHLNLKGRERQRVRPACQLLSGRTSTVFLELFPSKKAAADFIRLVNDSFDIMNSRDPNESNILKSPYGLHLKEQDEVLNKMYQEMLNMRVNSKKTKSLFPFQKGYLISISSLQNLYEEMKSKFNIKYILTHRLNQDVLENAFSVIRANDGSYNDAPNAVDAKCRVKTLLLGWNFGKIKTAPVQTEEQNPFLSYKLLSPLMTDLISIAETEDEDVFNDLNSSDWEAINADNWTDNVTSMSNKEKCEFYGKEYVAGFILQKLKEKDPHLLLNGCRNPASFTENLTSGLLTVPSYDFLNLFMEFENVFVHLFREKGDKYGIYRGENVMKILKDQLKLMFSNVSEKIIDVYCKTRIYIRIKFVNKRLNSKKMLRRNKIVHFLRSHVPDAENIDEIETQLMTETEMQQEWNDLFGVSESDMMEDWNGVCDETVMEF